MVPNPGPAPMCKSVINVSNRLPVTIADGQVKRSAGGLVTALEGAVGDDWRLQWLGWPGAEVPDADREAIRQTLRDQFNCVPIFISADEAQAHYEGFSNSSLWPLLHYMPTRFRYEQGWWEGYRAVNQRFADTVLSVAKKGDLVWVHDYQLMLLPQMIKDVEPDLCVGFFLHTPFPSYEVFRCHPNRRELAEGLLGADLIGFHTFGYLRHFRSSILRLLGVESEIAAIHRGAHTTALGVYPIGINAQRFRAELESPGFRDRVAKFAADSEGKRLVLSVERLDYTKGILHRLDAIDLFLSDTTPEQRDKLKFLFISVPSREGIEQYRDLCEDVEHRIGRLNGKHATLANSPIHFLHAAVDFSDLCALYALADVCIVTPLIDGMNLVAKEFVACQRPGSASGPPPGVLVLSEFAGAAEELFNALTVNPYDARAVAQAIAVALEMPEAERRERMAGMLDRVTSFDARAWSRSFIGDLSRRQPSPQVTPDAAEAKRRLACALGDRQRVALFLDYDGTLREIEPTPAAAQLNAATRLLLDRLAEQVAASRRSALDVTIVSGRSAEDLGALLGEYPFTLIAEDGAALRPAGRGGWEHLDRSVNYDWKVQVLKILRLYETSTPGSFVETKRTSVVWHYRNADPEFGTWKAKQLATELESVTANEPVEVRRGRKVIEVVASHVNKGSAVRHLLGQNRYELVLVAGDDVTDEAMFRLDLKNLLSIKVGLAGACHTHAQYRLRSPASLRRFLFDALPAATVTGATG